MKKFTLLMFAAGLFSLSSCTDNDDADPNAINPLTGTYRLTSWTAPVAQDLDGDGDASANSSTEHDCYTDWTLILSNDHSYTHTYSDVFLTDGLIDCETTTETGIWERDGNSVILTNSAQGSIGNAYSLSGDDQILTLTYNGEYPLIFEEIYILEPGTVTTVYTKQL